MVPLSVTHRPPYCMDCRRRKPGQSLEDAIFAEKLREDSLRDLGWQIVRWLWADLYRRGVIRDRVLRAFARASS